MTTQIITQKARQKKRQVDDGDDSSRSSYSSPKKSPTKATPKSSIAGGEPSSFAEMFEQIVEFVNGTGVQTVLYFAFVMIFQAMADTIRMPEEFYFDKHVMGRIVENTFDSSHNTYATIRRPADIYEWGNNVLLPGLFANMGPCYGYVGDPDHPKTCNDDAWPDGEGSFHMDGATPYSIADLVKSMDRFDWTEGIYIKQIRTDAQDCPTTNQIGLCYPEITRGRGSTTSFGHNWTHPNSPPSHPWEYHSVEELGANEEGIISAAVPSMRTYDSDGYVAVAIPFFSDTFLPRQVQ